MERQGRRIHLKRADGRRHILLGPLKLYYPVSSLELVVSLHLSITA